ncbi:hypothetical protein [Streptomyces pristinaespiralis]|uniref:hypothetical protein n=1 Tax=Streptomyces pristinaespiralis TaxID=38300 RepID=UPI0033C2EE54
MSLGEPFADGELIGKAALPDDLRPGLPPTTSASTPRTGHTSPLSCGSIDGGSVQDHRAPHDAGLLMIPGDPAKDFTPGFAVFDDSAPALRAGPPCPCADAS